MAPARVAPAGAGSSVSAGSAGSTSMRAVGSFGPDRLADLARAALVRDRASRDLGSASLAAFDLGLVDRLVGELVIGVRSVDFAIEGIDVRRSEAPEGGYRSEIVVRQLGDARLPAEVELRFADGTTRRTVFRGESDREVLVESHDAPLVAAEVDPDRRYAVDRAFMNNARSVEPLRGEAASIPATIVVLVQAALHWLGALT